MAGRSERQPEVARVRTRIHTAVPTSPTAASAQDEPPVFAARSEPQSESNAARAEVETNQPVLGGQTPTDPAANVSLQSDASAVPFGLTPTRMLLMVAAAVFAAAVLSPLVLGGDDRATDEVSAAAAPAQPAAATVLPNDTRALRVDAADAEKAQRAWAAGIAGSHEEIRRNIAVVMATAAEVYAVPPDRRAIECQRLAEQMAEFNGGLAGAASVDAAWGLALNEASDWLGLAVAACGTSRDQSAGSHVHAAQRALGRADDRITELDRLRQATPTP